MELDESAEELLETLWIRTQEEDRKSLGVDELPDVREGTVSQLLEGGYVVRSDGQLSLTGAGRSEGRRVVRRHRLAERLLTDILSTRDAQMHEKACKFEHLLDRDLDESICTLLGHPKVCPHGKPIPPGRCCVEKEWRPQSVVFPLSQLKPWQQAKIAYVYAPQSNQLQKLMSMGVLPDAPIRLIQSFPSYVFQMGQTQFAVDREIADAIYVRLVEAEELPPLRTPGAPPPPHRRFGLPRRFRWGRRGR